MSDQHLLSTIADAVERQLASVLAPTSTYRVQFRGDQFRFSDAAAIAGYLGRLGVSHLYASPVLAARHGSPHGYDVVDHSRLNPELGTDADFDRLVAALRAAGLGQIWDIVPNHMGIAGDENVWWRNVLENGPSSPYGRYFDVDWRPAKQELRNKVLLPILGEQYGRALEQGQLQLEFDAGAFWIRCHDFRLPLEPKSYATVLSLRLDELKAALPADDHGLLELESILTSCGHLPEYATTDAERIDERQREKEVIKRRLERLFAEHPTLREFLDRDLRQWNGDPADPASFDLLDKLLDQQVYRLAHWKAASDEINYRRFFDVNELAAVCTEDHEVFERTHALTFERLAKGDVSGLRIDHVDGLLDPAEYLRRLQRGYLRRLAADVARKSEQGDEPEREGQPAANVVDGVLSEITRRRSEWSLLLPAIDAGGARSRQAAAPAPEAPPVLPTSWPLYVVVEKILEADERLSPEWPIAGTTGYDFLNDVGRLFVEPRGYTDIVKSYRRFTGIHDPFSDIVYDCKRLIVRVAMASELQLLSARLNRLSEAHRTTRDFTLNNIRDALREVLACFPVYRTYITGKPVGERDQTFIHEAVWLAQRRNPALDRSVFEFVRDVLLLESPPNIGERDERARKVFLGRFQQAAGPVMAKGVEDTAFYRYFPLASLNEVGGAPAEGGLEIGRFHAQNQRRRERRPHTLLATTTHDTKRTEDTRARISVLSEIPREWSRAAGRWARLNRSHVRELHGTPAPSRNDEYLCYQTLVGVWPLTPPDDSALQSLTERVQQYMSKATHEAKEHTSWINPDGAYDEAVREFVAGALKRGRKNKFLPEFQAFHDRIVDAGLHTALSQAFLKLTSPGVPDIYQGQEWWGFSLVDPDNRRPVDFAALRAALDELAARWEQGGEERRRLAAELGKSPRDPCLKLFVTWRTLQARREHRQIFAGEYLPLEVQGSGAGHVVAFARQADAAAAGATSRAVCIAPRLLHGLMTRKAPDGPASPLGEVWGDTAVILPPDWPASWIDQLTGRPLESAGGRIPLTTLLTDLPVSLLL